jgi:hypothetical protein
MRHLAQRPETFAIRERHETLETLDLSTIFINNLTVSFQGKLNVTVSTVSCIPLMASVSKRRPRD